MTYQTRNQVAQLALNTLQTTMVTAEDNTLHITTGADAGNISITGGQVKYVVRVADNASRVGNAIKTTTSSQGGNATSGLNGMTLELGEQLYQGDLRRTESTPTAFNDPAVRWTYKTKEIGVYAKEADLIYTKAVKLKDIYKDLGLSASPSVLNGSVDGNDTTTGIIADDTNKVVAGSLTSSNEAKIGGNGTVTKVYYAESSGTVTVTITQTNYYLVKAAENYDSNNEEVDVVLQSDDVALNSSTLELDDFANIVNVKEDDYLVVTVANGDVQTVAPAEKVADVVVTAARSTDYVTAGQKYTYNDDAEADTGALGYDLMQDASKYKINDKGYNVYLDPNGYVLGVEPADGTVNVEDYIFIKNIDNSRFEKIARALFVDGTTKTITVDKLDDNDIADVTFSVANGDANQFYTYRTDKDGNYELTSVTNQGSRANAKLDDKAQPIRNGDGTVAVTRSANSSTVFIAKNKAYVGVKNAPETTTLDTVYYVYDPNYTNRLLIAYVDQKGSNSTTADDIVFILDKKPAVTKDADGTTYYTYNAVVNGTKTEDFAANQNSKPAGLYVVATRTDDRADLRTAVTGKEDLAINAGVADPDVAEYKNGTLIVRSGVENSYIVAENAVVRTIEKTTVKTIGISGVKSAVNNGFTQVYLVQTSSTNTDITTVYLVKASGAKQLPDGSNKADIDEAFANNSSVAVDSPDMSTPPAVPAGKTLTITGTTSGAPTAAPASGDDPAGKVVVGNTTVTAGQNLDLSGAKDVEFTGVVTVPATSTLTLSNTQSTMPEVKGAGTVVLGKDMTSSWDEDEQEAFEKIIENNTASGVADNDNDTITVNTSGIVTFKGAGTQIPGFGGAGNDLTADGKKLVQLTIPVTTKDQIVKAKITKSDDTDVEMKIGLNNAAQLLVSESQAAAGKITFTVLIPANAKKVVYSVYAAGTDLTASPAPTADDTFTFNFNHVAP